METLREFISRITGMVGCFNHKCKGELYSLKLIDTNLKGRMGVFAWVRELKRNNVFEISTYKILGDKSNVSYLADKVRIGMHFVSKKRDCGEGTGIIFYIQKGSRDRDYEKAVKALRAIYLLKVRE